MGNFGNTAQMETVGGQITFFFIQETGKGENFQGRKRFYEYYYKEL